MEFAEAASHASAAAAAPAADPQHAHYPHPYAAYPYPYDAYYPPALATDPSATAAVAASSSYYYPVAAPAPASTAAASYDPYSAYQYYAPPAGAAGAGAGGTSQAGYYFAAGEASHQPAVAAAAHQPAVAATGKDSGKHLGFDPQRYAQAAAARASKAQPVSAPRMHHAQWNAHFGHPLPKNVLRKHIKKKPKVVQPAPCEVCNIQCDTLEVLLIHKQGKKHKKNLEKLQDSITPKPLKAPSNAIGPTMAPSGVANGTVPVVQQKKKCSSAATPEELEVKKRRVLEAGAAQGEVKICNVCNVVVNSQKVYEFHIAGQKHQAMVQKQQAIQFVV
ncbi:hypothetical protein PR202_gb29140 [Eleusine coracana subsp. coracana]|uniref:U1-type domain-containing protein n=1 Tax=Eleusine coracana subsp. coracana TaxID=191504 RepID=A0AAV5FYY1_ELECO|nr:hypothetical protein PR202_gb29140 [Eleusine coracana subsp. coracana]